METITINENLLKDVIKEAIDGVLNTNTNNTFGGDVPGVQEAIELMEGYEWEIDQVSGNLIYAHLAEAPELEVVVMITRIDGRVVELHYKGDEFNNSWCIDINTLVNKLAELDF